MYSTYNGIDKKKIEWIRVSTRGQEDNMSYYTRCINYIRVSIYKEFGMKHV